MNEVHGTNFSEKFWTRLLIPYAWTYYNQREHYEFTDSKYPIPFQPIGGWSPPGKSQVIKDILLATLRSLKGKYSPRKIGEVLPRNGKLVLGIRGEIAAAELDATFVSFNWIPFLGFADPEPRKRLMSLAEKADSPEGKWLVEQMPEVYLEYFGRLLRIMQTVDSVVISDIYVEHYGSFFDRLLAFYLSERGASVNQLQLGGYIGETIQSVDAVMRFERDKHLTYGWRINPEDIPFYSIRLEQFRAKYESCRNSEKKLDLLVVYNHVNSRATREHYEYCSDVLRDNLSSDQYPKIMLRPRGSTRLLSAKKSLRFLKGFASGQIGSGKEDMAQLCAKARLVIHWSHPSTNLLECIFVDQPVVAVQLNSTPTDIVKPHYRFLKEVGILHDDPSSLVNHISRIDVESWWSSIICREEYQLFKRTFARSKDDYMAEQFGQNAGG